MRWQDRSVQFEGAVPFRWDLIFRSTTRQSPAPRLVVQRAESFGLLPVKIKFGGVLQTQNDPMSAHPVLRFFPVGRHHVAPIDIRISKESVRRTRFRPALAGHRDARRRVRRKSFHQYFRPLVEATVTQVEPGKFLFRPALRCFGQRVTQGSRARLPAPSPLRTVRASFDAHGSSLYEGTFRHPVAPLHIPASQFVLRQSRW